MASYHFSVQVISRKDGRSAVAAAAYRAGERIECERDGLVHDYSRKQGVLHSEVALPAKAPKRWLDRSALWNEVEQIERGANAQLAREFVFAVPHELETLEAQTAFCRDAVSKLFVDSGMVADWSLHDADGDGHNIHCHVMCAMRSCDEDGFLAKSENVYLLRSMLEDRECKATARELRENPRKFTNYEKVYLYRAENGAVLDMTRSQAEQWFGLERVRKQPIQETRYLNNWNDKENSEAWRSRFADIQNEWLEWAGSDARVDHRSYERQGIDRVPQEHEGPCVTAIERRAERRAARMGRQHVPVTAVRQLNVEIAAVNAQAEALDALCSRIAAEIEAESLTPKEAYFARLDKALAAYRELAKERGGKTPRIKLPKRPEDLAGDREVTDRRLAVAQKADCIRAKARPHSRGMAAGSGGYAAGQRQKRPAPSQQINRVIDRSRGHSER